LKQKYQNTTWGTTFADNELHSIPLNKAEAKFCLSVSGFAADGLGFTTAAYQRKHITTLSDGNMF